MTAQLTIVVIAATRDPHRQSEALRAALGLTLRGARVEVVVDGPLLTPLAQRAADTLRAFGYPVVARDGATAAHPLPSPIPSPASNAVTEALSHADRVEVWT